MRLLVHNLDMGLSSQRVERFLPWSRYVGCPYDVVHLTLQYHRIILSGSLCITSALQQERKRSKLTYDVLVVGGGPAGIIAATTARKVYGPEITIALVRPEGKALVPCGIPYMFGTLDGPDKNVMGDSPLVGAKVEIVQDEIVSIDREAHAAKGASGRELAYRKLVLATGSEPIVPASIPGTGLANVFTVRKSASYLSAMVEQLAALPRVVIIGGGFIGVEFADELIKRGATPTLIELMDNVLWQSFDPETCTLGEKVLTDKGVKVLTGVRVEAIIGSEKAEAVRTDKGDIAADAVIMSIGARPYTSLAKSAGLTITPRGAIAVDSTMRTSDPDVFAVGDCASKRDFFSGAESGVMLASFACMEARAAGANLFSVQAMLPTVATPAAFSTMVGNLGLGSSGLTETDARRRGLAITVGRAESVDKHPGTLPGTSPLRVKLVFSTLTGQLLGGQIAGGASTGELANVLALAIANRMTAADLFLMPVGTHPLLTAAPTTYPIINAAWDALNQLRKH